MLSIRVSRSVWSFSGGASRRLLGLVDDVLDLARLESGHLELDSERVDVALVVCTVADGARSHARRKGLALQLDTPPHCYVLGDGRRLRQLVGNLVDNAIKFTECGHIALSVSCAEVGEDGLCNVVLTCEDTGVGIRPERIRAVLEPFVQADQGMARQRGGSGLGLSIVARMVDAMGGHLDIDSTPGQGTVITVRLTLPAAQGPEAVEALASRRVLLAEDNRVSQQVVSAMLERLGCEVTVVEDGAKAVAAVVDASLAYDLVFMDCQMPGTDGFTATRILRAARVQSPIVALTANSSPADRAACLAAGMDDFAAKPVTIGELAHVLSRHGLMSPAA